MGLQIKVEIEFVKLTVWERKFLEKVANFCQIYYDVAPF